MNALPILLLFVTAWLVAFAGTQFPVLRAALGTSIDLLPALIVHAALQHSIGTVTGLAVLGGLWTDALSGSPLGISVAPLFAVGFLLHTRQHLLLRRHAYAQFWLGLFAGAGVPLAVGLFLRLGDRPAYLGPGTGWQLLVGGLANGLACPVFFLVLDRLRRAFEYQPVAVHLPGPDREMKRGRR